MNIKNCTCKTNAVLVKLNEEEVICCLRCKTPYTFNSKITYGLKMPFNIQNDGTCFSEITLNRSRE